MKSDEGKRDDQDDNRYDKGRWRRHRLFCFEIYRKWTNVARVKNCGWSILHINLSHDHTYK